MTSATDDDPVLGLIAQWHACNENSMAVRGAANTAFFALPEEIKQRCVGRHGERLKTSCGELERQARAVEAIENRLWLRITATKPRTPAGALAILELMRPFYDDDAAIDTVIAGLRDMVAAEHHSGQRRAA